MNRARRGGRGRTYPGARSNATLGWLAALCLCGLGNAALVGCGNGSVGDRPQIGAIVFQEDQYFRLVELGMRNAAKNLNVDIRVNNTFNAVDKEIAIVDTYLVGQMDAIVVAPVNSKNSIAALRRAHEQKTPVVTFDTVLEDDFPVAGIRSDQIDLGRQTGEAARKFIEQRLGGKAVVAMITTLAVSPELGGQRVKGFQEAIQQLPGVQIVAQQDAWLAPAAAVAVEGILTAHPEVNLVWSANEGGTVGAVTAVATKGLAGKVFVFGTDMSEQLGAALQSPDDVLQAVTGQRPYEIGQRAVEAAVKAMRGETVEKSVTLPGVLFAREKPKEIDEYLEFLRKVSASSP